jgi:hypothetical protein
MQRAISAGLLALLCAVAAARGSETEVFQIAGVGPMELPMTEDGAPPAKNRKMKVDFAGFMVGKRAGNPREAALIWTFGFRNKSLKNIESVRVEEVSPTDVAIVRVLDESPKLIDRGWIGTAEPQVATRETQPWLYSQGMSVFVFRFTVKERGQEPQVLYQPTVFSPEAKQAFRRMIEKIQEG